MPGGLHYRTDIVEQMGQTFFVASSAARLKTVFNGLAALPLSLAFANRATVPFQHPFSKALTASAQQSDYPDHTLTPLTALEL